MWQRASGAIEPPPVRFRGRPQRTMWGQRLWASSGAGGRLWRWLSFDQAGVPPQRAKAVGRTAGVFGLVEPMTPSAPRNGTAGSATSTRPPPAWRARRFDRLGGGHRFFDTRRTMASAGERRGRGARGARSGGTSDRLRRSGACSRRPPRYARERARVRRRQSFEPVFDSARGVLRRTRKASPPNRACRFLRAHDPASDPRRKRAAHARVPRLGYGASASQDQGRSSARIGVNGSRSACTCSNGRTRVIILAGRYTLLDGRSATSCCEVLDAGRAGDRRRTLQQRYPRPADGEPARAAFHTKHRGVHYRPRGAPRTGCEKQRVTRRAALSSSRCATPRRRVIPGSSVRGGSTDYGGMAAGHPTVIVGLERERRRE